MPSCCFVRLITQITSSASMAVSDTSFHPFHLKARKQIWISVTWWNQKTRTLWEVNTKKKLWHISFSWMSWVTYLNPLLAAVHALVPFSIIFLGRCTRSMSLSTVPSPARCLLNLNVWHCWADAVISLLEAGVIFQTKCSPYAGLCRGGSSLPGLQ